MAGREEYFEERRTKVEVIEIKREKGSFGYGEIERRERQLQREERWERIRRSEFNKWYGRIKSEGVPEYLRKGWGRVDGEG